jgi:hypothetical protein
VKQVASRALLKMEETCSSKISVDFSGLYGIVPQKIELLITTAVRTSDPTTHLRFLSINNT